MRRELTELLPLLKKKHRAKIRFALDSYLCPLGVFGLMKDAKMSKCLNLLKTNNIQSCTSRHLHTRNLHSLAIFKGQRLSLSVLK